LKGHWFKTGFQQPKTDLPKKTVLTSLTRTDKCVEDKDKNRDGNRLSDSPNASQMEIGGTSEVGDMI